MNGVVITAWLNSVFSEFDYSILFFLHGLAQRTNGTLTFFFEFISFISEKGILFLLIGIVLFCFKKTRKTGACLFGSVCFGSSITLILKHLVSRPRPFAVTLGYYEWWQFIGAPAESGCSFPSGHTTVVMAAATALFLSLNKKGSWLFFLYVILIGISRCYLMVHYPSDILGGIVVGAIGAVIAFYITRRLLDFCNGLRTRRLEKRNI